MHQGFVRDERARDIGGPAAMTELVSLPFADEPEVYDGFTIHRGAKLTARRGPTGRVG